MLNVAPTLRAAPTGVVPDEPRCYVCPVGAERPLVPHIVGRYALYDEIGSGGTATVHCGRLVGPAGFSRTVAIKRLHPPYAKDPEFVSMFLDEARMAARIRHPNVVPTIDVVARDGELFLVMDYVAGETLSRLLRASDAKKQSIPTDVVSAIVCGVLHGLHAAHEATNDRGEPLEIVHRDVSPQNVLVGADGVARVLDFGVARATGRIHTTRDGRVKGKLAYMSPEQLRAGALDRRTDVFGAGILLWESLTLRRLFAADSEGAVVTKVLDGDIPPPSRVAPDVPRELDEVTLRALERDVSKRYASAREMALSLEACVAVASPTKVGAWVEALAADVLAQRATALARVESESQSGVLPAPRPAEAPGQDSADEASRSFAGTEDGATASQVSSISVSTTRRGHRAPSKGAWKIATFFALVGIVVVVTGVARWHASLVQGAAAPPEANPPPPPEPLSVPPSPSVAAIDPTVGVVPSSASAVPASPHAKPCSIKSFVDSAGIKHFVRVCK
jgi:serine/threonine protein kinase